MSLLPVIFTQVSGERRTCRAEFVLSVLATAAGDDGGGVVPFNDDTDRGGEGEVFERMKCRARYPVRFSCWPVCPLSRC